MFKTSWTQSLSCLVAACSLGYFLADPTSAPLIVPLFLASVGACLLLRRMSEHSLQHSHEPVEPHAESSEDAMPSPAQQGLIDSERHIHRVLDQLFAFVCVLSPEGTLLSVNAAPLKAAAIRAEDVVGKPLWECSWWAWSPVVQEQLRSAIARAGAGSPARYDAEIRVAGGALMSVDFMVAPMLDDASKLTHLIASGVDVSDRKQAEIALSAREQFYRQLIESMPLLCWTCQPDGTCDYICARWEKYAGYGTDPAAAFTTMEHVHHEDREAFRAEWQDGIRSGRSFKTEVRLRRNDGVYRWFGWYATPISGPRGQLLKWCGTSIDINDRKQMEEALRESELRLRSVNNTLEQRVKQRTAEVVERSDQLRALALDLSETESRERKHLAQVLHDHFQQLVSAAKLKTGLLRRKTRDEDTISSLRQVESLLEEAIVSARMVATQLSPPVLHDAGLVAALQWLVRRMELDHQLKIELVIEHECELDNEQVRVIVFECAREILFNVRKHAGVDFARLTLRLLPEGLLRLEVVDEGKGFDALKLARRKSTDMSFGLFSIRERMSLIGGLLRVESAPGKGTRVELSVPCVARPKQCSTPMVARAVTRLNLDGNRRMRVVVADDHALFREGLVALLSQEPYLEVIGQAGDGEEAIRMSRELRPDLLIVDISMPKFNGVQVTKTLTKELPGMRVIGLSMYEQEDMTTSMLDAGAIGYFAKSGAPEETLLAMLREVGSAAHAK